MSVLKPKKPAMALGALLLGVIALPVAGFFNWMLGLALLTMPIFMIYAAS